MSYLLFFICRWPKRIYRSPWLKYEFNLVRVDFNPCKFYISHNILKQNTAQTSLVISQTLLLNTHLRQSELLISQTLLLNTHLSQSESLILQTLLLNNYLSQTESLISQTLLLNNKGKEKVKGIWFIVLYSPKRSHDLPPLVGLYTRKPFQSPEGYYRAVGSIQRISSKHCLINARYPFCSWVDWGNMG